MEEIEMRVKGHIDTNWSGRLGGLTISHTEGGNTILTGHVRDQSALIGLMNRISGLGLRLVSVSSSEIPIDAGRSQM